MGSFLEGEVPLTERLCVDDPLTGRDVAVGSYRIDLVKSALQKAARRLEALAKGRKLTDTTINYLSALFDVQKVRVERLLAAVLAVSAGQQTAGWHAHVLCLPAQWRWRTGWSWQAGRQAAVQCSETGLRHRVHPATGP